MIGIRNFAPTASGKVLLSVLTPKDFRIVSRS